MCPYQPKSDWDPKTKTGLSDRKCDGRAAAMKVNPLRFNVRSLKSYYNRMDIKHALVSGQAGRSGTSLQPPSSLPRLGSYMHMDMHMCMHMHMSKHV